MRLSGEIYLIRHYKNLRQYYEDNFKHKFFNRRPCLYSIFLSVFLLILEGIEGRGGEREKHKSAAFCMSLLGIKPKNQASALRIKLATFDAWDNTQPSHTSRAVFILISSAPSMMPKCR